MFADGGVRFLFDKNKANFLTYISNLSQRGHSMMIMEATLTVY